VARSRVGGRGAAGRGCARLRQAPRLVLGVLGVWPAVVVGTWAGRCTEGVVVHLELPQTPARTSGWVAMPSGCGCGCASGCGCGCESDGRGWLHGLSVRLAWPPPRGCRVAARP
jgi:hypothetical protein